MTDPAGFTSRTPRNALPMLFAGQAQKEFTVNEALAQIDTLLHPAIIDERDSPPAAPVSGECYLVASGGTGEFAGQDENLAGWDGQQWTFFTPLEGMVLRDLSTGELVCFKDGWQRLVAPSEPTGGSNVDIEARDVISELVAALKAFGIFS